MAEHFPVYCPRCVREFLALEGRDYAKIFKIICPRCGTGINARDVAGIRESDSGPQELDSEGLEPRA